MVPFLRAKKPNVPTLGPRFLVKFPRVGKAIEVKCPTYARGPHPLGFNIDRCIIPQEVEKNKLIKGIFQINGVENASPLSDFKP